MQQTEKKISVAVITLGCKVNKYESDSMKDELAAAGFLLVEPEESADFYIVNTCSVTNMAQRKSRQMLRRAKKWNPEAVVIAAGCYVNAEHEELLREAFVDIVVGNNCKKEIVEVIRNCLADSEKEDYYLEIGRETEYEEMGILGSTYLDHQRAYVKVQDGCNQFCSYCIIPYTRGRVRSRQPEQILKEIESLAAKGVKEFVLTGIHISSYGVDFQGKEMGGVGGSKITDLGSLVQAIAAISEVRRIRLGSLEPRVITREFIDQIDSEKLCPHFHLSLQSACNDTLKRMNRRYTIEEFEEKCNLLRERFDLPAITTDVIVGFPGESEEEFAETVKNLERLHFYEIHVFKYSARKGTVAERLPSPVPETVKGERSDILLALTARQKREYEESLFGIRDEVLIEERVDAVENQAVYRLSEKEGAGYYTGHSKRYVRMAVVSDKDLTNEIVPVTL